jgi:light-regulated signal transduction histidine kinase (bacteriophytochrome)
VLRHTCTNARFEVGELPDCRGDVALMKQLWLNLLDNAAKYSSKHETPLIQVDFAEGFYRVRDNGVGFEQKYVDKVFGVFTRLHSREEFEGTGIGMAVAKRVVERHGGVIEAEGRPGNGATFRFRL